jgi:hypothetical protein
MKKVKQQKKRAAVGDLVFLPRIGVCRVLELHPDAKDDEFNLVVKDSRGVLWASDLELVVRDGPTPAWVCRQRARLRRQTARGRYRFRDCVRN